MFKNKKAVSPLVGMLLLVVFAIALGSVVMSFSGGDTGSGHEEEADDAAAEVSGQAISAIDPCMSDLMNKYEQGKITQEEYNTAKSIVNK